jgi:hypothetical protein
MEVVSDEPFYSPNRQPDPPRQLKSGEHVWSLRKNGRQVDCELRFHGESYGWECQCLYNGDLGYGRRFVLRADALEEAESQRRRLLNEGWIAR